MAQMLFKNFQAGSRKPNMLDFGLFPSNRDLSWIANNTNSPATEQVVSATDDLDINVSLGTIWMVTLTEDVLAFTINYDGSSSNFQNGQTLIIKLIQDGTGGWQYPLPSTVRAVSGYAPVVDANFMTTWYLQWYEDGWDFLTPPVISPAP